MRKNRQLFKGFSYLALAIVLWFGYSWWSSKKVEQKRTEYVKLQQEAYRNLSRLLDEFSDALLLADALPRESLPNSIEKMQSLRQLVYRSPLPHCFDSDRKLVALESRILKMTYYLRYGDRSDFLKDIVQSNQEIFDLKAVLDEECQPLRIIRLSFELNSTEN